MNLKNKTILITGASSGIGKQLAKLAAKEKMKLILLARNEKKLNQIYDEIKNKDNNNQIEISLCPFDLSIAAQTDYENLLANIQKEYGLLDILFLNAAILEKLCPVDLFEPHLWLKIIQVNLNASFLLCHYLLPLLKKAKQSQIWFMSSSVSQKPRANWGAYSVSKAAQDCLMQLLTQEQTNIIVNSINPGATNTKMRSIAYPYEDKNQLIQADENAQKIINLIKKTQISGQIIQLQNYQ